MNSKISELQQMLRYIEVNQCGKSSVYRSGTYDDATKTAVENAQKRNGLDVNGIVDTTTWNAIVGEYLELLCQNAPPEKVSIFPLVEGYSFGIGDFGEAVRVLQIMLNELRRLYDVYYLIDVDGEYGRQTEEAVRKIQRAFKLSVNGRVDKTTWNSITMDYNYLQTKWRE